MNDSSSLAITGEVFDSVVAVKDTTFNGKELKAGEEMQLGKGFNLVVENFSVVVATLLKGEASFLGKLYWEVGSGEEDWNDASPPSPTAKDLQLVKPTYRKLIQNKDITYLDSESKPTAERTNKIEILCSFGTGEANGALREFSLFSGGDEELGSGLIINRKTHGKIYKTPEIELRRKIHFTITN